MGFGGVPGYGGIWDKAEACLVIHGVEVGVCRKICLGSPCFGPWLPIGIVYFVGFGDVSGSGGIWDDAGACLVRIGGEEWVLWKFCLGYPCFGPWIPLGLVYF